MAQRQEQEDAQTQVTEVAPNILRMQLPISMPGLGHVNCYALIDDEGAALVDPGLPGSADLEGAAGPAEAGGPASRRTSTRSWSRTRTPTTSAAPRAS